MYIDWILFIISICLISWSFFSILIEWDQTKLGNFYSVWAGTSIAISISITFALLVYFKKLSETLKHWSYNCWISILYARSCHVWVESVANQHIIKKCGQILTLGAPLAGNITCECPIHAKGHYALPFITAGDSVCQFTEDQELLKWVMTWETVTFAALIVHLMFTAMSVIEQRKRISCSILLSIDILTCFSVALIPIIPKGHYSMYQIGGTIRFLGLMHAIIPFEHLMKRKQFVGILIVFKLIFITLTGAAMMFVAEKPCSVMYETCDDGFNNFGNTVYFIFVTLSTVGYGDMSPKTTMGKSVIIFIILAGISYLPSIISDILEMCRQNPLHGRLDEMQESIRQVGFFMHGGTESKSVQHRRRDIGQNKLIRALKRRVK
tara:strand:- start:8292 stop:9431 length:1140 start_codon:yes stop_codon:yes gene_type:complete